MTKIYLAHSIATEGEFQHSIATAIKLKDMGYDVYAPALNKSINDKSNNPTPMDIYDGDVSQIKDCDIFVININGGTQDGTLTELGLVTGLNEMNYPIDVVAYTSNKRLLQPQHFNNIPSASANHLVLGMIEKFGKFVGSEQDMLSHLEKR